MSNRIHARRRHEWAFPFAVRGLKDVVWPALIPWLIAGTLFGFYVFMAYIDLNRGNPQ